MATIGIVDFPILVKGDTSEPATFVVKENGTPVPLTDAEIVMNLRSTAVGTIVKTWSTADNTITITGTPGEFRVEPELMDVEAAKYTYQIQISFPPSGSRIKTWIQGSWPIVDDYVYP